MTISAALPSDLIPAAHSHLNGSHSGGLVAVSFALATLGSFAALASAASIRPAKGVKRLGWVAVTATALGGGATWSTHFVGIVAHFAYSDISFDFGVSLLSAAIGIAVAGIGIGVVAADPFNPGRLVSCGVFAGFGVAAMHYTGMAALRIPGTIHYKSTLVVASIAIAVLAATTALWAAFHVRGASRLAAASVVMATEICGMHYTGMAATRLAYDPGLRPEAGVDPFALVTMITFGAVIVLMFTMFAALGGVADAEFAARKIVRSGAGILADPPHRPLPAPTRPADVISAGASEVDETGQRVRAGLAVETCPHSDRCPSNPAMSGQVRWHRGQCVVCGSDQVASHPPHDAVTGSSRSRRG